MATYKQPCIQCGAFIDGNARYCPSCASANPFSYHCPACHYQIKETDALCAGCGKPLRVTCPTCGKSAFVGKHTCDECKSTLMRTCANPRCGQPQFFLNTKCTACGKKIKIKKPKETK